MEGYFGLAQGNAAMCTTVGGADDGGLAPSRVTRVQNEKARMPLATWAPADLQDARQRCAERESTRTGGGGGSDM